MNRKTLLTAVIISLIALSFVHVPVVSPSATGLQSSDSLQKSYVKTELYFGLSKNTGGYVSQDEWNAFEDSVIVRVFSSGSTTLESRGRWMNENNDVIKENSRIVVAVNVMTPGLSDLIDSIREKYKRYFDQSSVLRIDYRAEVSF
jgi:Protein of unknown function (DUF3574)